MHRYSTIVACCIGWASAFSSPGGVWAADDVPAANSSAQLEFFENRIRPILVEHCFECHSETSADLMGGLLLDSREGVRQGGDSGPAVVPFAPEKSLLLEAIAYSNRDFQMPPDNRLSKEVIKDVRKWITMGAADPRSRPRTNQKRAAFDLMERKSQHWAWRPPRPTTGGMRIDGLINRRLDAEQLTAAPRADPRTLIRRLSFDLIGLPPTLEEVNQFLAEWEVEPDVATETLVKRLLADLRFGEHWARHWLDVVRFSETKGHVTDQERPFAWRYRDYVIDAFNDDLPYDQFITEHIAGDLLDERQHRPGRHGEMNVTPTATGALFMHEMHFMAVDPVKQRWDEINAQIDLVSKAFLGLTVECARCHDHKFDAISQADYYALAGFFYSTEQTRARIAPRQPAASSDVDQLISLEQEYENFLQARRAARVKAQTPKASGKYFPVSEELGIQSPRDTAKLFDLMAKLEVLDPSWRFWTRSARDVDGRDVSVLIRGDHRNEAEVVPRRFLTAITGASPPGRQQLGSGSGRLWLASQVTSPENPLPARVWVNRLWHHLFGRGIVATPNNFGTLGEQPSHPELLDYLALRLREEAWSTKAIIREIVQSQAYQRSSRSADATATERDPDNRWLARGNRRRLTAEQLRDAMLLVAGSLDPTMHGPSVGCYIPPYATANKPGNIPKSGPLDGANRRSIYLKVRRIFYDPFLMTFDFPDRGKSIGRRHVTIVPGQSLAMLNSPLVHELAGDWANLLVKDDRGFEPKLNHVWQTALGRPMHPHEGKAMRRLVAGLSASGQAPPDVLKDAALKDDALSDDVLRDIVHVVFNHPEFMWIE